MAKHVDPKVQAQHVIAALAEVKELSMQHSLSKVERLTKVCLTDGITSKPAAIAVAEIVWPRKKEDAVQRSEFTAIAVASPVYDSIRKLALEAAASPEGQERKVRAHNAYLTAARYWADNNKLPDASDVIPKKKDAVELDEAEITKRFNRLAKSLASEGWDVTFTITKCVRKPVTVTLQAEPKAEPKAEPTPVPADKQAMLAAFMEQQTKMLAALMSQ